MRFENSRVIVTGAASGIGRATAMAFVAEGATVVAADINQQGLEETAALCGDARGRLLSTRYDAGTRQGCCEMVARAVEQLGGLDVLCNIAGFAQSRRFTDYTEADWERILSVNLSSVFYTCQAVVPHLLERGGSIVNMSSSAGLVGQAYQATYCATKAAVIMLTKSIALEYAASGIRANAICPGVVNTPLSQNFSLPDGVDMKLVERLFPLLEMAEAGEIAAAILYLASRDARFITGAALPIDGGQTAG